MPKENRRVLVISCLGEDTGGGLFAYDGKTVEQLDTLSTAGLALADDRLGRLLWSSGEAGSVGELLVYDEAGISRYFRIDSLREPHDLAWDGEAFVAVSTMSNSIVWLSPAGEVARVWKAEGDGDAWHLNSVSAVGGRLVAAAFGRFSRHRGWADGNAERAGIVFDLATGEDIVSGLSCPHDPRLVDGLWLVCNSARRELVAVEASSGAVRHRVQLDGWTRGLAVAEDKVYVGESANRASAVPGELGSVAVIDRQSWAVVDRVALPCQEVFDVIEVPHTLAQGVRQGFRTNPLRTAEQDQHALFNAVGVRPARLWAVGEPLPAAACRVRIEATVPGELGPGTIHECECLIENIGDAILVSAPPNPVHISHRWLDRHRSNNVVEGGRSVLPEALVPAAARTCTFSLKTPERPGDYRLAVTLVQEQVAWFDDLDEQNAWSGSVRVG
jgi:acetolactate synthase I/II/III large subunit